MARVYVLVIEDRETGERTQLSGVFDSREAAELHARNSLRRGERIASLRLYRKSA